MTDSRNSTQPITTFGERPGTAGLTPTRGALLLGPVSVRDRHSPGRGVARGQGFRRPAGKTAPSLATGTRQAGGWHGGKDFAACRRNPRP